MDERERDADIPVALGATWVARQLSTFLPQLHLTLISVLQGVALAVLTGSVSDESPFQFPAALLYVDGLVLLALVWHQYSWVFVSYLWPLSFWHPLAHFGLAAAECYAFVSIEHPDRFIYGFGAVSAVAAVIRLLNVGLVGPENYEPRYREVYEKEREGERRGALRFGLIAVGCALLGALCGVVESEIVSTVAALLVLGVLLRVGSISHAQLDENLNDLLAGSRWRFHRHQIIERERDADW